jgi:hypothetical protein
MIYDTDYKGDDLTCDGLLRTKFLQFCVRIKLVAMDETKWGNGGAGGQVEHKIIS